MKHPLFTFTFTLHLILAALAAFADWSAPLVRVAAVETRFEPILPSEIASFADLKMFIRQVDSKPVTPEEKVAELSESVVGMEISDTWEDETFNSYEDPMVCVNAAYYTDANGTARLGVKLRRKYASRKTIAIDGPNAEEATEATAQAGVSYIGRTGTTDALLNLATGAAIPYASYDKVFRNAYNNKNAVTQGLGDYPTSDVRQYLNSAAGAGQWWGQQRVGQVMLAAYSSIRGYKAGCSAALLAAAKPVKVACWRNLPGVTPAAEFVTDTFFIDSATEVYGVGNDAEGPYDAYWKIRTALDSPSNAENAGRISYDIYNHATATLYWLRSNASHLNYVLHVGSNGQVKQAGTIMLTSPRPIAPCCVIY